MSREIKFRAWNGEEMVSWPEIQKEYGFWGWLVSQPAYVTLMQFTGLKDKNGVEIYEGDILVLEEAQSRGDGGYDNAIAKVFYDEEFAQFQMEEVARVVFWTFPEHEDYLQVIGNIYENPELWEEA